PLRDGGRARRRAAHGLRGLFPALRRRPQAVGASLRGGGDAVTPRAPRCRRGCPPDGGRQKGCLYFRGVVDDDLPPSTGAPEGARGPASHVYPVATFQVCRR